MFIKFQFLDPIELVKIEVVIGDITYSLIDNEKTLLITRKDHKDIIIKPDSTSQISLVDASDILQID